MAIIVIYTTKQCNIIYSRFTVGRISLRGLRWVRGENGGSIIRMIKPKRRLPLLPPRSKMPGDRDSHVIYLHTSSHSRDRDVVTKLIAHNI